MDSEEDIHFLTQRDKKGESGAESQSETEDYFRFGPPINDEFVQVCCKLYLFYHDTTQSTQPKATQPKATFLVYIMISFSGMLSRTCR